MQIGLEQAHPAVHQACSGMCTPACAQPGTACTLVCASLPCERQALFMLPNFKKTSA